jgi:glutaredoxin-like protein
MPLLSAQDRATVQSHLAQMTHRVTLLFFTQSIGAPETVHVAKQVLGELADLNPLITIQEMNIVLDREQAAKYGVELVPSIVLLKDGADTRMRFVGAPAGYEFTSLIEAVALAGSDGSGLQESSKALLAARETPLDIKVFVTPTCVYCPRAVTLAHRMAAESPLVTSTCVEATEFPELSRQYQVTGVPKTVAGEIEILGAMPENEYVSTVLGIQPPPSETPAPTPT